MDALEAEKIPGEFEARGQGFRDGAEDVRLFRRAFLTEKAVPVVSLLMRAAMAESRTVSDPAGNSKLAKSGEGGRRVRARDDAAAAAIQAVALGMRRGAAPVRSRRAPLRNRGPVSRFHDAVPGGWKGYSLADVPAGGLRAGRLALPEVRPGRPAGV